MARPDLPDAGLLVRTRDLDGPELVELCAPCHSRRAELSDYDHTGSQLLDHMLPSLLVEGLYHPDGQILDEVYVYGSFLQSRMYQRGVTCRDCHDVHRLGLLRQGNALCLQCHQREVYDTADHHFHKLMVEGKPSDGALCVKCHMVEQPFMVVDWRADHSFRRPRPDLTAAIGTPNACSQGGCHDDRPLTWVLDASRRWYGQARRPHYGTALAAGRSGAPEVLPELLRLARDPLQPAIVRATALDLLGRYPGGDSTAALREALLDGNALIRRTAVATLVVTDPSERAGLLAPLLSDPVRAVRLAAVGALAGVPMEILKPYQRDAFAAAVEEYRGAMSSSLDFASSGFNLGNLEVSLGDPAGAERYYRLALAVDDLFFPAKLNLAVLLSQLGRNDEAGTVLEEVVHQYPDNADAASMLGLLRAEQGRPEEAVDLLRRAAAGMPREARVHYNLGLLLAGLGRDAEAEAALQRALELEPHGLDGLHALADFYLRRGRPDDARALAERMIAIAPDNPVGHQLRAMAGGAGG
jgi:tetratricopeptide (TPR) repeat protein